MKKTFFCIIALLAMSPCFSQVQLPATTPNAAQKALIKRGYGMFIHYGINTFNDTEWSDGTLPVSSYNPTSLNPDQWVKVARDAGFRYVLLTTKHHDGFCLWDSKYTDYDVAASPVKTNVVKAVSDACKKYGLQFAVYYSLWDRHAPSYKDKDPQKYIDYMLKQLDELFAINKNICEVWLDGGWDRTPGNWGLDQLYRKIKTYNPLCAMGVNLTIETTPGKRNLIPPSDMTEDNKYYFQYFPSDFRLWDPRVITKFDKKQYLHQGKSYYLPFEHTICISKRWNWFQKTPQLPVRDIDEMEELFYWMTDNDNCLVVNVPPDNTGRIREYEANAAIALGKRLGLALNKPLPKNGRFISFNTPTSATSTWKDSIKNAFASAAVNDGKLDSRWAASDTIASVEISLNPNESFNKISIFEYQDVEELPGGFSQIRKPRIRQYSVDLLQNSKWTTIYLSDEPMGDCKIIRLPQSYKASKLRLKVLKAIKPPSIYEICVIDSPVKNEY